MTRLDNIIKLPESFSERLIQLTELHTYKNGGVLYYEGQVPVVAHLLLEGSVQFKKGKRLKSTTEAIALFGLKELMSNTESKFTAEITPGSKICFLDKSTIFEILKECYSADLKEFFSSVISA